MRNPFKPEPWKRVKTRRKRAEAAIIAEVRAEVATRDGFCRLYGTTEFGRCGGASELAHLWEKRRFKTRGMAPEERHAATHCMMLCSVHHRTGKAAYDANTLEIEAMTPELANGPLRFKTDDAIVEEDAA